jgi:beta-glucanase (GH16 family)
MTVSIQAPDNWNSGAASATIHNLNWRASGLATTNDNASAFFVIVNLPSAASLVVPLGQITGLTTTFLSQYVTVHNQYDLNFSDGSSGHAYSISVTADQLSKLQSFLPSINKQFDAVLILTQHKGSTYVIVYATELGRMGDYIGTFQNILSSVRFSPTT